MLLTEFVKDLNRNAPLQEYPRPQLVRDSYLNLNGRWDFTISKSDSFPEVYDYAITVPYCVESSLSGINKNVEKDDYLIYRKFVKFPKKFAKEFVFLHIDAVDQIAKVYVNKKLVAESYNGYLPLVVDIKHALVEEDNEIIVIVKDELNHIYPYGKQRNDRGGMWYTPVSGIWQSVWIESMDEHFVQEITITPDIDKKMATIVVGTSSPTVLVKVSYQGKTIYKETKKNTLFEVHFDEMHLWDVDNPNLYDVEIKTVSDEVKSYFAMRKFSVNDKYILLNNKPIFINGLLDQGYFPDGIYTPASYKVYEKDIKTMKELGFNCLRKHIKIEPMIFYHLCDKLGMIVFQDMVNNGDYSFIKDTAMPTIGLGKIAMAFKKTDRITKEIYKKSMIDTLNYLYNVPCIGYYTIFNEGWGQHDADDYYNLAKSIDSTRIFDSTSGWFKEKESDVESLHVYFKKIKLKKSNRPIIVSEYGGYAMSLQGHVFNTDNEYGYKKFKDIDSLNNALYDLFVNDIVNNIKNGLAGCIYTQVSDVEDETNGLFTYDRQVLKVKKEMMLKIKEMIDKEYHYD